MTGLPPLPDHRPAVLRALASLGAVDADRGVVLTTIAARAGLGAGQAWLAIYQLTHAALVASSLSRPPQMDLYWLTADGLDVVPHLDPAP